MTKTVQYGHWKSLVGAFVPLDWFGFLYLVYCKETKKFYIGKKQTISQSRVTVKGQKRKKIVVKESDWLTYCTSSTYIKADIKKYGEDAFEFYIVGLFKTKGGLKYAETNMLHKFDVNVKSVDSKERMFYNLAIDAVRFVVTETDPLLEKRIQKIIKGKAPCLLG